MSRALLISAGYRLTAWRLAGLAGIGRVVVGGRGGEYG